MLSVYSSTDTVLHASCGTRPARDDYFVEVNSLKTGYYQKSCCLLKRLLAPTRLPACRCARCILCHINTGYLVFVNQTDLSIHCGVSAYSASIDRAPMCLCLRSCWCVVRTTICSGAQRSRSGQVRGKRPLEDNRPECQAVWGVATSSGWYLKGKASMIYPVLNVL